MSLIASTLRAVFVTTVGGGTVYGSIKAGVWSTDGNKSVETLREVKLHPSILLQRDSPVNRKYNTMPFLASASVFIYNKWSRFLFVISIPLRMDQAHINARFMTECMTECTIIIKVVGKKELWLDALVINKLGILRRNQKINHLSLHSYYVVLQRSQGAEFHL